MNRLCLVLISSLLFISSCNKSEVKTIDIGPEQLSTLELSEIVKDHEFFIIEATQNSPFSADKIIYSDSIFIILDRSAAKKAYLVDSSLNSSLLGQVGRGPGEYTAADDLYLDRNSNEIIVFDRTQSKLIYFGFPEGRYIRERVIPFLANRFFKTDHHFYFVSGGGHNKIVIVTDHDFNIVEEAIDNDVRHIMAAVNSFLELNGQVIYHTSFSPYLYVFESGKYIGKKMVSFESDDFTEEVFNKISHTHRNYDEFFKAIEGYRTRFYLFEIADDMLFLSYEWNKNPAVIYHNLEKNYTIHRKVENIINDITFQEHIPIITGADNRGYFLAFIPGNEINIKNFKQVNPALNYSLENPTSLILRFKIKTEP